MGRHNRRHQFVVIAVAALAVLFGVMAVTYVAVDVAGGSVVREEAAVEADTESGDVSAAVSPESVLGGGQASEVHVDATVVEAAEQVLETCRDDGYLVATAGYLGLWGDSWCALATCGGTARVCVVAESEEGGCVVRTYEICGEDLA